MITLQTPTNLSYFVRPIHLTRAADPDPVSAQILEQTKKRLQKGLYLSEENLKSMTKDRQKMKEAIISYQNSS